MDQKPLTKEDREEIVAELTYWVGTHPATDEKSLAKLAELLASEAYWREAVKNAAHGKWCAFCHATVGSGDVPLHKPDCPWLLAQNYPE